jgi:hypothetical protein
MSDTKPRPYDDPDISATRFLVAVMHDKTVDLKDRMTAADLLCKMGLGLYKERTLRITIHGGMPRRPRLEDFPPEMQRDLLWIKRCYELGIENPDINDWDIKGHG